MKKLYTYLLLLSLGFPAVGQNINDALRYGQENLSGTARFTALSGAFGALGGDVSGFTINPAGTPFLELDNEVMRIIRIEPKEEIPEAELTAPMEGTWAVGVAFSVNFKKKFKW